MAQTVTTVTAANLIQGPGTLFTGSFGATEPADTAVNVAPQASAWADTGGHNGGVSVKVAETFVELEVDQLVDIVERRRTKREITVEAKLAEVTFDMMVLSLNGGTTASGAGFKSYEPDNGSALVTPTYKALLFDGPAPGSNKNRRFIIRKVLSIEGTELAYSKEAQQVLTVTWGANYVSNSIRPFKLVDEQ